MSAELQTTETYGIIMTEALQAKSRVPPFPMSDEDIESIPYHQALFFSSYVEASIYRPPLFITEMFEVKLDNTCRID